MKYVPDFVSWLAFAVVNQPLGVSTSLSARETIPCHPVVVCTGLVHDLQKIAEKKNSICHPPPTFEND
jgi:hypothetical protein